MGSSMRAPSSMPISGSTSSIRLRRLIARPAMASAMPGQPARTLPPTRTERRAARPPLLIQMSGETAGSIAGPFDVHLFGHRGSSSIRKAPDRAFRSRTEPHDQVSSARNGACRRAYLIRVGADGSQAERSSAPAIGRSGDTGTGRGRPSRARRHAATAPAGRSAAAGRPSRAAATPPMGKGVEIRLGRDAGIRVTCGDEPMAACLAAAKPLTDRIPDMSVPPAPPAPLGAPIPPAN